MVEIREGSALLHMVGGQSESEAVQRLLEKVRSRAGAGGSRRADGSPRRSPDERGTDRDVGGFAANAAPAADPRPSAVGPRRAGERSEPALTCSFCGQDFVEDRSQATCQACPLSKACSLIRCPHCGFENVKEPGWLTKIRGWIG